MWGPLFRGDKISRRYRLMSMPSSRSADCSVVLEVSDGIDISGDWEDIRLMSRILFRLWKVVWVRAEDRKYGAVFESGCRKGASVKVSPTRWRFLANCAFCSNLKSSVELIPRHWFLPIAVFLFHRSDDLPVTPKTSSTLNLGITKTWLTGEYM